MSHLHLLPSTPSGATTTAALSATATAVNYVTADKAAEVITSSILEYSFLIMTTDGIEFTLSIRDMLFIMTASITIFATLRIKALRVRNKRRRKSDICKDTTKDDY